MAIPVIFLSGAGLPEWVWDDVRDGLKAPTIVASRPGGELGTVTEYARAALAAVPEGPFVIVAHSAGGVVASELVRLARGRVAALLGIAAVIPRPGASFVSSMPLPNRIILPVVLSLAGTRPPDAAIRGGLAAGVEEGQLQRLLTEFTPEPREYFTSRAGADIAAAGIPTTSYLVTTEDAELTPGLQRRYAARLGASRVHDVATGHLPMLTHPEAVLAAVRELSTTR